MNRPWGDDVDYIQFLNSSQNSPSNEEAGKVDEALKRGEKSLVSEGKPPKPSLPPRQEPRHAPPDRGIRFFIEAARPPLPGLLPPPRVLPDAGANPPSPPSRPDRLRIIGPLPIDPPGPPPRPPPPPLPKPHPFPQSLQLLTIMFIPRPPFHAQRKPSSIHHNMPFRPFPSRRSLSPHRFPPFFASIIVESTPTSSTATFPSASPPSKSARKIFSPTPFSGSSWGPLHAVGYAPYRRGRSGQRQPVIRTDKIPWMIRRSSARGLPVRALGGSRGGRNAHCSSVSSRNAIASLRDQAPQDRVYYLPRVLR